MMYQQFKPLESKSSIPAIVGILVFLSLTIFLGGLYYLYSNGYTPFQKSSQDNTYYGDNSDFDIDSELTSERIGAMLNNFKIDKDEEYTETQISNILESQDKPDADLELTAEERSAIINNNRETLE